ncbi:MAG: hypothetical protein ABEH90_08130 [Halolamina sp.]
MAIRGEDLRRRTGVERVLSWFDTEDEELSAEEAYQTLEDEYLY